MEQASNKNNSDFQISCTFQGHYNEPPLTLTVPKAKLLQKGALEFNMIYHVDRNEFEKVEILDSVTKQCLVSEAQFEVASTHHTR